MKKVILVCIFVVVVLMCFGGCRNKIKGEGRSNDDELAGVYKTGDAGPGSGIVFYVSKEGFYVYDGKRGKVLCHHLEMSRNTLSTTRTQSVLCRFFNTSTPLSMDVVPLQNTVYHLYNI